MRTNADLTWYKRSIEAGDAVWTRTVVRDVFWEERKAANVMDSGIVDADSVSVYVPFSSGKLDFHPEDILVRGIVADEIVAGTFNISDLEKKYPSVVTIRSVDVKDFGSYPLRHTMISAS